MSTRPQPPVYKLAETTEEAYSGLIPTDPLGVGDSRYVALDQVRGHFNLAQSFCSQIKAQEAAVRRRPPGERRTESAFARLLLTGHPGCGKTTELFRLKDLLEHGAGFTVVYYDAEEQFDLVGSDISWWNVVLETIWQLDDQLPGHGIKIPEAPKDEAAEWIASVVTKKQTKKEIEAGLEAELGAEARLPFVARVKAAIRSAVKLGSTVTREVEIQAERRPKVLVDALGEIVRSVNQQLDSKRRPGLVVIVDGLEKMPLKQTQSGITSHAAMFMHNSDKLASPPCHLLYTLPLTLLRDEPVAEVFPDEPEIMPVVHVVDREGNADEEGVARMIELLHKRVSPALLEDGAARSLAIASGGHVRDFVRLARRAAREFGDTITLRHANTAINGMIDYYDNLYAASYHDALVSVHQEHRLPRGEFDGELIEKLLVLPYRNDQMWCELHPCVLNGPRGLNERPRGKGQRQTAKHGKSTTGSKRGKSKGRK
jgi:energy-coupling factor transporter ATP-binding protein EcfA2